MVFNKLFGEKLDKETTDVISMEPTEKARYTGKIIHKSSKGWGFISTPEIPFKRIFFHWSGLNPKLDFMNDIQKGMKVSFSILEYEDKGLRAIKIELAE